MATERFYQHLPAHSLPMPELLRAENFRPAPPDWWVVIADVRDSTAAVESGRHNDVNLVAAGALTAVLNVAREARLEIPFFFGGDGGTLIVPDAIADAAVRALRLHCENVSRRMGLDVHHGAVCLEDVYGAGRRLEMAKSRLGYGFSKAVVVGDGLQWAEHLVKGRDADASATSKKAPPNLQGLECRWDRVRPPAAEREVVCYLIEACDAAQQVDVYADVLRETDKIFGAPEVRNPLSVRGLKLLLSGEKMRREMMVRYGRWKWRYFAAEMFKTAAARMLLKRGKKLGGFDGGRYLQEVVANADTLTLDGRVNTIICGTPAQREAFLQYLDAHETAGRLRYGHHVNRESIMTCYVEARAEKHIHFVDGSDGGYTAASRQLKAKLD